MWRVVWEDGFHWCVLAPQTSLLSVFPLFHRMCRSSLGPFWCLQIGPGSSLHRFRPMSHFSSVSGLELCMVDVEAANNSKLQPKNSSASSHCVKFAAFFGCPGLPCLMVQPHVFVYRSVVSSVLTASSSVYHLSCCGYQSASGVTVNQHPSICLPPYCFANHECLREAKINRIRDCQNLHQNSKTGFFEEKVFFRLFFLFISAKRAFYGPEINHLGWSFHFCISFSSWTKRCQCGLVAYTF